MKAENKTEYIDPVLAKVPIVSIFEIVTDGDDQYAFNFGNTYTLEEAEKEITERGDPKAHYLIYETKPMNVAYKINTTLEKKEGENADE